MLSAIAPLSAILIYGYMLHYYKTLDCWYEWTGICYMGIFRAWAGLCMGALCWSLAEALRGVNFTVAGKRALAAAQIFISLAIVLSVCHKHNPAALDRYFLLIPFVMILFAIIDSEASPVGKYFRISGSLCKLLADYSLALYVSHWSVVTLFIPYLMPSSPSYFQRIGPCIFCALVYSLLILVIGRKILRLGARLKKYFVAE